MNSSFLLGWAIKQPLGWTTRLPPVNWFCAFVDRQSGVLMGEPLGSELHLCPLPAPQGLITAATETALMLGRVPIHFIPSRMFQLG